MFLVWLVGFALSLTFIQTSIKLDADLRELSADASLMGLMGWSVSAMALAWLGVIVNVHLKEMLGSPNSRVTPNLIGPHLTVATIIAAFAIGIPSALAFGFGFRGSHLTAVTLLLAAFSIAAFLAHWFSYVAAVVGPLIVLLLCDPDPSWSPSLSATLTAIVVSSAALLALAFRFRRFNEEMVEYRKRMQVSSPWSDRRWGSYNGALGSWNWVLFVQTRQDFRALRRSKAFAMKNTIQRALHWHAAWHTVWPAIGVGVFLGCLVAEVALISGFSIPELLGSPNIPYLAIFPALRLLGPQQNRPYLAAEFLRPESRKEHVNAVGLTLASMVLLCWLLMLSAAFVVLLLVGRNFPSLQNLMQSVGFSMCCLVMAFGLAVWPYRTSVVFFVYTAMFGVMGSFALTPLRQDRISGFELGLVSAGLLVIGVFVTRWSYLRWLNHDVDFCDSLSWISKLPRDRRIESELHELVVVAAIEDRNRKSSRTNLTP
jgi:hypothetical protein